MENHQYIVAIGASAGGLEALSSFFDHTPIDSVSYIIIPHLSIDFKSRMVEILSRHSTLEVLEAEEGMAVKINKVYIIPNTKYMGIKEGHLFLSEKEGHSLPHLTIDSFFTSLAKERGHKAIGVVLSGVGRDGSRGALAIEEAGGVIMVQSPSDAKFDGMPKAAIALCKGSYALTADELPLAIQQYISVENTGLETTEIVSDAFLTDIIDLINEYYPFDFTSYKIGTLSRRIKRRMAHHNFDKETDFLDFLRINPEEIEMLIVDFLIGVTSFFRDPEAFEILETEVIPQIILQKSGTEFVKIWVACCASGEEAYSLAILVKEYLIKNGLNLEVKIFATDINKNALDHASKGVYPASVSKSLSPERLQHFFDKVEGSYKIKPEIREMLIFARHDLIKHPPYCYVDLVSCRNMLIYIKPALQKKILSKLSFGLRRNGYLFLGSSENISFGKSEYLEVSAKWKIYQIAQSNRLFHLDGQLSAPISDFGNKFTVKLPKPVENNYLSILKADIIEVILYESGFCGVNIDQDGKVIQAFGDLSPYLRAERFIFNLKKLLPEDLYIAYSASVNKVRTSNERIRVNNIEFYEPGSGKKNMTDMVISPYLDAKTKGQGMLVLFKNDSHSAEVGEGHDFKIDVQAKEYISQLEDDLSDARLDLHSSVEFLETSKEAMHAFNEELLSANEEMQSANEELQSINEELEAVNSAHKYSINELTLLNDDLNNYFRSNTNGQLFVDQDILLKKYSPGAIKHINIRESDIGRPLSNITTNIRLETLVDDIKQVISNGKIVIQEVESNDGKFYEVTTSPYLRGNQKEPSGAIITFYDVTALKIIQSELLKSTEIIRLATDAAKLATWSINLESRKLTCSARLNEIFGYHPDIHLSLEAMLFQIVKQHQPIMQDAIEKAIHKHEGLDIEFPILRSNDHSLRWIKATGNLTHQIQTLPGDLIGVMEDITDRKLDELRKNDFIAIVSHELKSPITSIQGYLQILLSKFKKVNDQDTVDSLDRAVKQVKKMTVLINGFLNLSQLETGKIYLDKEDFEINDLIQEILNDISATQPRRSIVLSSVEQIMISADRNKLGQVISNLLSNAVKYSSEGTTIYLNCEKHSDMVQLSVKDEGMGVSPEEQVRLFDRYYRIQNGETKRITGFGIGLYLCAEIVQRHSGKIWLESQPGKGSTFYFSVPCL